MKEFANQNSVFIFRFNNMDQMDTEFEAKSQKLPAVEKLSDDDKITKESGYPCSKDLD